MVLMHFSVVSALRSLWNPHCTILLRLTTTNNFGLKKANGIIFMFYSLCLFMHFTQVLRFLLAGLLSEEILIVQFVGCD